MPSSYVRSSKFALYCNDKKTTYRHVFEAITARLPEQVVLIDLSRATAINLHLCKC